MYLYNGTGCLVFLIGSVTAMPEAIEKNSDAVIIVTRKRHCFTSTLDKMENYRVILTQHDASRILKFGFPGMTISVRGDLRAENNAEIIAEKIDFIDLPNANQFAEMSYWFARDGFHDRN